MIKLLRDQDLIDDMLLYCGATLAAIGLAGALWIGVVYP